MKTALQEFIDNVIPMHIIELDMIKQEINKALEKEKEQIMNAFLEGKINHSKDWAIEYYNQTYNN
jgi:hypothetical protein